MASIDTYLEFDEDIINEFGDVATLLPSTGGSVAMTGIFEQPSMLDEFTPNTGAAIVRLFVRMADITPQPARGDKVTINSKTYDVTDLTVDSIGGGTLRMKART